KTESPSPDAPPQSTITVEEIARKRQSAENAELSEEVKSPVLAHYGKAADFLQLAAEAKAKAVQLKADIDQLSTNLELKKQELAEPLEELAPNQLGWDLSQLEQQQLVDQERLSQATKSLEEWEARAKVRGERQPQMPVILNQAQEKLAKLKTEIEATPPAGENPMLTEARKSEQTAQLVLLERQLDLYRVEQFRYDALKDLFPLQRDDLVRRKKHFTKRMEIWKETVAEARRLESERQAREAQRQLQEAHPVLRELAERNASLTKTRTALQDSLAKITQQLEVLSTQLESTKKDFTAAEEKVKRVNGKLTTAVGLFLTNQRDHLPNISKYEDMRRLAADQAAQMQAELMDLEDERAEFGDIEEMAETFVAQLSNETERERVREMAYTLLQDRRRYLLDLIGDYNGGLQNLADLEVQAQNLVTVQEEFRLFIDERVLWIRSAAPMEFGTLQEAATGFGAIAFPGHWVNVAKTLWSAVRQRASLAIGIALACLVLVLGRYFALRWMESLTERTRKQEISPLLALPAGLWLTAMIAVAIPITLWLTGWLISNFAHSQDDFSAALGLTFQRTALYLAVVEALRQLCRRNGVGRSFLGWPDTLISRVSRALTQLLIFTTPVVIAAGLSKTFDDGRYYDSLGRVAFLIAMAVLTIVLHSIFKVFGNALSNTDHRRSAVLWKGMHAVIVCCPLSFGVLSTLGYHYTALKLLVRLELTIVLAAGLLALYSFAKHWVEAAQKSLHQHKRFPLLHRQGRKTKSLDQPVPEDQKDPIHLAEQFARLAQGLAVAAFLFGTWNIWIEVLPAMQAVSNVELWRTTAQVLEVVDVGDGQTEARLVTRSVPITLSALLFAGVLLTATAVCSRHLRAVLELLVFRTIKIDEGAKHAFSTMGGYVLWLTGTVWACQTIGIGWSSVQWLVAALTVGLGFGLQEIFANFVSGLILLLERPVRVGDVVTIDSVTGTVSRIHIRATTILDHDQKEYIVPNKEFVTGRLLNWTLSNKTNRVLIPVGVAYGSDTDLARELMEKVATGHPLVLRDPVPTVTFDSFGDSALNLTLRCYLPDLSQRLKVITELNRGIDLAFRQHGIEIPFPQMDLHVNGKLFAAAAAESSKASERKAG
ncbi:MAG: mechanosensitive ion channel, partial [Planctomycetaceae bacterium]|nr:mechanosensitive ion channel [Planctomycetaceae bacterium]